MCHVFTMIYYVMARVPVTGGGHNVLGAQTEKILQGKAELLYNFEGEGGG